MMMTAQYWWHQSGRKDTEMWNKQWERVDRFLKKWKLIERGDHILLGISGGADSVCLARYFLAKRESLALNLYAVHVNHMLRGDEAKRDEEFVREFCRQWNIPLHVEYRDIKKAPKWELLINLVFILYFRCLLQQDIIVFFGKWTVDHDK